MFATHTRCVYWGMLSIDDFLKLRQNHPVFDVRSEAEFDQGHIPAAVNIPVLTNEERKIVGTTYKQQGPQQAVKEGIRLVGPRLSALLEHAEQLAAGHEVLVHCWRGGMRSNNFCWLIEKIGIKARPLQGGYKAYRTKVLSSFTAPINLRVLTGSTGSGKTEILQALKAKGEQIICLESLANHKGSAFGGLGLEDQPTTEQFQNDLFEVLHTLDHQRTIWVEDESIALGKIFLPEPFWRRLRSSPVVKVDVDKQARVQRLVNEYGPIPAADLLGAMQKIVKRLGGQHFNAAREALLSGDLAVTAEILLTYYDHAYEKTLHDRVSLITRTHTWNGVSTSEIADALIAERKL